MNSKNINNNDANRSNLGQLDPSTLSIDKALENILENKLFEGRYKIIEELNSSVLSTSKNYLAEDTFLNRKVQLKILTSELNQEDNSTVARFKQEGLNLSKLIHPGIIKFYNCGLSKEGLLFQVVDHIEGQSLEEFLQTNNKIDSKKTFSLINQISSALISAHAQGFIHRDICPRNIIIHKNSNGKDEQAVISNFSLAKFTEDVVPQANTQTVAFLANSLYMSPELRKHESADKRSDIYSLACILVECLTGELPYKDSVNLAHTDIDASFNSSFNRLPKDLQRVLKQALELNPTKRFQNIEEFNKELNALASSSLEFSKYNYRRKKVFILNIFAFITVLCLSIFAALNAYKQNTLSLTILPNRLNKSQTTTTEIHTAKIDLDKLIPDFQETKALEDIFSIQKFETTPNISSLLNWVRKYSNERKINWKKRRELYNRLLIALNQNGKTNLAKEVLRTYKPKLNSAEDSIFYASAIAANYLYAKENQEAINYAKSKIEELENKFGIKTLIQEGADLYLYYSWGYQNLRLYKEAAQALEPIIKPIIETNLQKQNNKQIYHIDRRIIESYLIDKIESNDLNESTLNALVNYRIGEDSTIPGNKYYDQKIIDEFIELCQNEKRPDLVSYLKNKIK